MSLKRQHWDNHSRKQHRARRVERHFQLPPAPFAQGWGTKLPSTVAKDALARLGLRLHMLRNHEMGFGDARYIVFGLGGKVVARSHTASGAYYAARNALARRKP